MLAGLATPVEGSKPDRLRQAAEQDVPCRPLNPPECGFFIFPMLSMR
jgi:hypothetical protein